MDNNASNLSLNGDLRPRRHSARNRVRSVCWIDAHLGYRSPTMVHLLHALPHLRDAGWEIEASCLRSDAPRDQVRSAAKWVEPLELQWFVVVANLYEVWRRLHAGVRTAAVIHATSGTYLSANLITVQLVNAVWTAMQIKLGLRSAKHFVNLSSGFPEFSSNGSPGRAPLFEKSSQCPNPPPPRSGNVHRLGGKSKFFRTATMKPAFIPAFGLGFFAGLTLGASWRDSVADLWWGAFRWSDV
jgi:hypothetical protein